VASVPPVTVAVVDVVDMIVVLDGLVTASLAVLVLVVSFVVPMFGGLTL
jgi:hypothetical protein